MPSTHAMTKAQEQFKHAGQQSDSGEQIEHTSETNPVALRPPSYMEETPAPAEIDSGNATRPIDNNVDSSADLYGI
ncbi:hypothetical protein BDQ17DRAFT_1426344 [Cyathus striatus]|nr:hypothetical protein BDQ17DRAFT_1426344 [Cyathus striatus]